MKNTWLLFKQGSKSIFKFKIQFIVIILLSFFASFYLVSTTSLNSRMNKSYNEIVRNYEKFDYSYATRANESNLGNSNKTFLPILDFLPNSTNLFKENGKVINDSFNLVLNNHGLEQNGYQTNFITKSFFNANGTPTDELKNIWGNDFENGINQRNFWGNLSEVDLNPNKSGIDYYSQGFSTNFGEKIDKYDVDLTNTYSDPYHIFTSLTYMFVKLLSDKLYEDLKNDTIDQSMQNSLFYTYWKSNELEVEKDFSKINLTKFNVSDTENTEWYDEYKKQISSKGEYQLFIYNALESVSYFITSQIRKFLDNSYLRMSNYMSNFDWNTAGNTDAEKAKKFVTQFNEQAIQNGEMQIFIYLNDKDVIVQDNSSLEKIQEYNRELTFEYIFGSIYDFDETVNNDYVVNFKDVESLYQIKASDDQIINNGMNIEKNGLRGLANPAQIEIDSETSDYRIKTSNSINPFEKVNTGDKFENENNAKKYDFEYDPKKYKTMYDWFNPYSSNLIHQQMAANKYDLDFFVREEAFFYDRNTKTNFRFVITNDKYDYNFKVTAGLGSMHSSEIVISQQYAFKNGYSVGDRIKIGNANFIISGFGSDALTYYPLADPEVPITDFANSVIVYAPKAIVEEVMNLGNSKDVKFTSYFFIKDAINDSSTIEERMQKYDGILLSDKTKLSQGLEILDNNGSAQNYKSINNIKNFEDTYFNLNWTLQPKLLSIINLASIVTSLLVIIMAFVSIVFGIKKTIDYNSNQIGFLKSQGVGCYQMSVSYTAYSLLITLIIVPFAWLTAGLFQELITKLFASYFATTLYEFVFDFKILLILILVFGVISFVFSYLIALFLVSKDVLKIINKENETSKWRNIIPRKLNIINIFDFKFRFPLKVSLRGTKQIFMMSFVAFFATLVISLSILTPSMLSVFIIDAGMYYKYDNQYMMDDQLTGLPTAKSSLTASRGIPYTESIYQEPKVLLGNNDNENVTDIYFNNNKYYADSSWDSSLLPPILFGSAWDNGEWKQNLNWTEKWIFDDNLQTKEDSSKLLKFLNPAIGQLGNFNGSTISAGIFEKISSYVWNTEINPNTGKSYFNNVEINDNNLERIWNMKKDSSKSSGEFVQMALQFLVSFLNSGTVEGLPPIEKPINTTWKENLILLALSFLPNAGQQYLRDSSNRATQFSISLNSENYTPNIDSLSTEVKASINDSITNLTGLKSNQNVYNLNSLKTDDVFISKADTIKQLNNLFEKQDKYTGGDIYLNDKYKIYDSSAKILNIPVITNLKSYKQNKLKNKVEIRGINYKALSIDGNIIPKNAWIYDNREITESSKSLFDPRLNMEKEQKWIDPSNIDSNKFTYTKQFEYDSMGNITGIHDQSKWFINSLNEDDYNLNTLDFELRPYYHYNNLKLFVPRNITNSMSSLLNGKYANTSNTSVNEASDWRSNIDLWHGTVNSQDVPDNVKLAWGSKYSNVSDWEWIAPFSINYSRKISDPNRKGWIQNIATDLNNIYTWASDKILESGSSSDALIKTTNQLPSFLNGVYIEAVDTIPTYNGNMIIADQDILNLLTNKSTAKYIPVDYDFYGDPISKIENGQIKHKDHTITINEMKNPVQQLEDLQKNKKFFMKDELKTMYGLSDQEAYEKIIQNRDFNSKYSGFTEAYGITGGIRGIIKNSPGVFAIGGGANTINNGMGIMYNGIDLVSTQLGIIVNVSESILLIAMFLITGVILIALLVITIISDVYIMKYHRFMVTMKALGYSRKEITLNTLLIPIFFAFGFVLMGYLIAKIILSSLMFSLESSGVFIPVATNWWATPLILVIIATMFVVAFIISLRKPMKDKLKSLT
ncbi:ABC transporter permease [Mesoplasma entomophilum]|uniref:ABC3 transporter permease C-terminal domain-containing protein n=1 Tax=Mesoplasma entomophilum TaxID=2149 RepID=A0A3S5XYK1_9MOLU|nr:ABC transporter permease [Mesoplasma entomophilum]ATQ35318.1 hypothetical protein CS528_00805 [Mesoplasma entomophilum]ATZ19269.1 ABC transporter permease [Mesoplasma entomophilum]